MSFFMDAKKLMKQEVHVERPILPAPCNTINNNNNNLYKDDTNPAVCDTKVPAGSPVEMKKKKWLEKVSHVAMVTSFPASSCCFLVIGAVASLRNSAV